MFRSACSVAPYTVKQGCATSGDLVSLKASLSGLISLRICQWILDFVQNLDAIFFVLFERVVFCRGRKRLTPSIPCQ